MKLLKIIVLLSAFGVTSVGFSQDVFTTKTGEKYHKEMCRYLSKSKYRVDLKDAIRYGMVIILVLFVNLLQNQRRLIGTFLTFTAVVPALHILVVLVRQQLPVPEYL